MTAPLVTHLEVTFNQHGLVAVSNITEEGRPIHLLRGDALQMETPSGTWMVNQFAPMTINVALAIAPMSLLLKEIWRRALGFRRRVDR